MTQARTQPANEASGTFWQDALALRGSVTARTVPEVLAFTALAAVVYALDHYIHRINLGVDLAPYEVAGAALGLLLVLRTNAGYDRWWEGRKLWGGIVNQSRTLATTALSYGPDDRAWRDRLVRWTAAYGHACRRSLRGERDLPEVAALLGVEAAAEVAAARHMPTFVALRIAGLLREGAAGGGLGPFAFLNADAARNLLIDHVGGCERIVKSPLPRVYGINIRRFIAMFLATLPFALLYKIQWLTPVATFLVAYPILALDRIGVELQNPFDTRNLGHLPLDAICETIEGDLLALLDAGDGPYPAGIGADTLGPLGA